MEAAGILSRFGKKARLIAGGTDLLVNKPPWVECLIDVENLDLKLHKGRWGWNRHRIGNTR